jgi:glutathione S-transferase
MQYVADQAPAKHLAPFADAMARSPAGLAYVHWHRTAQELRAVFDPAAGRDWKAALATLERRLVYVA